MPCSPSSCNAAPQRQRLTYDTPEGQAEWDELAEWRALDGEGFLGFEDEDSEEEAHDERRAMIESSAEREAA